MGTIWSIVREDTNKQSTNLVATHVLHIEAQTNSLDDRLRSFWELEALGIIEPEKTMYEEFSSTINFKNGQYQVSLPWKSFHKPLPTNYELCLRRLHGLLKRLRHNPKLLQDYNLIIQEQIQRGIVEEIPKIGGNPVRLHYLPHHAVMRNDKTTTKLHVVYDASAKSIGKPSLNDCLYVGPKFNQMIFDILVRFRSYPIALTADIEKAFLMISVEEQD